MTRQTLAADVLDALLTTWRADATLLAYNGRLRIFDGPPLTDRTAEIELWVGASGDEPEEAVITGTQDFVAMRQADDRDETLEITTAIWVYATDNTIATARRTAIDVFNAAAGAIRASDLGIADLDDTSQVVSWTLKQGEYPTGPGVVLTFVVSVTGQL